MTQKMRIYTGPTLVDSIADKLTAAGITVTTRGTESVWVWTDASVDDLLQLLPTWKPRDIWVVS